MNKEERKKQILQMFYAWGYRYLARNKSGWVYFFTEKPTKGRARWLCKKGTRDYYLPFDELFGDVTFNDAEPLYIAKELGAGDGNDAK